MKNFFSAFLVVFFFSQSLSAQFEIKVGPIVMANSIGLIAIEYGFNDKFGTELTVLGSEEKTAVVVADFKYYFKPRRGLDRLHVGMFVGVGTDGGVGFLGGTKLVSKHNLFFEAELGLGRSFDVDIVDDIDDIVIGYLKLCVGYRFGPKSGE